MSNRLDKAICFTVYVLLFAIAVFAIRSCDAKPVYAQAPPPRVTVWARALTPGDRDRDWFAAWSIDGLPGDMEAVLTRPGLPAIACKRFPLTPPNSWWQLRWHQGYRLPPDARAGEYTLFIGGQDCGPITVLAPDSRTSTRITPAPLDTDRIERLATAGHVILAPGEYTIDRPLRITSGATLRGYGARFRVTSRETFASGCDVWLYGITIHQTHEDAALVRAFGRINAVDVTVIEGTTGNTDPAGCLWERCLFVRCSVLAHGGMYHRCEFVGHNDNGWANAFQLWGQRAPFAMVKAEFRDTDRGPVLQPAKGQGIRGALLTDVRIGGHEWVDNGCEAICMEGTTDGIRETIFSRFRVTGGGAVTAWYVPVVGCVFDDFSMDRAGFYFEGSGSLADSQTRNRFQRSELRGGGFRCGPGFVGNVIEFNRFVGYREYRANQFHSEPGLFTGRPMLAIPAGNVVRFNSDDSR